MASASFFNMTASSNTLTTKTRSSDFCPPFRNVYFETVGSSAPYILNAALNVPLAITTTFVNLVVLLAMRHVTSIRLPSKLLLCSLLLTDIGAGSVVQPQFVARLFTQAINPYSIHSCFLFHSFGFTASLFSYASLFTMTAIGLDRYTALFYHLKYQQILTTRRVCAVLTFTWSASLFVASAGLWNTSNKPWPILAYIACFLVISVAYIKIYRRLRGQHGHQVQPQAHEQAVQQAGNTLNTAKYKRTASAMIWVYVLFVICYLPFCVLFVVTRIGPTALTVCILDFFYTLVLLNSCLNPFVYCLRLPEIRTEVMKQLTQFYCRSPQQRRAELNTDQPVDA